MSQHKPYPAYKDSGVEWLGEVPGHWDIRAVKTLARLDGGSGFPEVEQGQSGHAIPFFKVAEMASNLQTTVNTVSKETAKRLGAKVFKPNTLVFAKVGAALLLNRRCLLEVDACLDNNMMALLPAACSPRWLFWVFSVIDMGLIANPGAVPSINQEQVGNIRLSVPPLNEQQRMAEHLDRETDRIDGLLQKNTRFIELLREKRQSLITEAVTKGLNPNVPMKDSGVEWLGEVPGHWDKLQIKNLAINDDDLFVDGDWIESKDISESGIKYITTGNVGNGFYKEQGSGYISNEAFVSLRCTDVLPGDIIISRLNLPIGRACIIPDLGGRVVTAVDNVILRNRSDFYSKFIVYRFSSSDYFHELSLIASGATMQRISKGKLGSISIMWPDFDEQVAISEYLDCETTHIDNLINKSTQLIAALKEKRQSLITEAVTGKIDLR